MLFTSFGFETQGLVLLEAAAMSLPTIYCDPALSETVPAAGGILAADPSPAALGAAIRLVTENRAKLKEMSDIVSAHPDIPRQSLQTKKILAIYNSLVGDLPA